LYAQFGRRSIPHEQRLRALLLQTLSRFAASDQWQRYRGR